LGGLVNAATQTVKGLVAFLSGGSGLDDFAGEGPNADVLVFV
jgi:hypothetical protein